MTSKRGPVHVETLAVHAGREIDRGSGAVMPPIVLSTTFARDPDGSVPHGYVYTRNENPNRASLEQCLAALEGGAAAAAFASGQAATLAVLQALHAGDHVILPDDVYFGTRHAGARNPGSLGPARHRRRHVRPGSGAARRCGPPRA